MNTAETIVLLNNLVDTSKIAEYGFRSSAKRLQSADLAMTLVFLSDNCQHRARELQDYIRQLGGHPYTRHSRFSAWHRVWLSARRMFSGSDTIALLQESIRGEILAIERYRSALDNPLPEALQIILERQRRSAEFNRDRIHDLLFLQHAMGRESYHRPSQHRRASPANKPGPESAVHGALCQD